MSFEEKLVWTEEDHQRWQETVTNLAKEMGEEFQRFYEPDPLMLVKVEPATKITIEEELNYNGSIIQFRVRFPEPCIGLVKVSPFLNGVQLESLGVDFKRGDKVQAKLKNIDKHDHIVYLRFFSKQEKKEA